jgi:hypothetical protein
MKTQPENGPRPRDPRTVDSFAASQRFVERRHHTKDRLLEVAVRIFSLRGLDGTSLRLVVNPTPAFDILYDRMLRPYTKPSRGLSPA